MSPDSNNNRKIMFAVSTVLAALIVAALVWFTTGPKTASISDVATGDDVLGTDQVVTNTGDVQIGNGNYTLTDMTGQTVTQDSYPGKYKLVFFGFTNCPDECPAALGKITTALSALGADANRVQPLFITVDPARDTAEQLRGYLTNFNPTIIGLTGTTDQIKQASDVFRAYYNAPEATPAAMTHDDHTMAMAKMAHGDGAAPAVEHSAYIYLLSPSNELVTVLEPTRSPDAMAQTIRAAFTSAPAMGDVATPAAAANAPSDKNSLSTDTPEETVAPAAQLKR